MHIADRVPRERVGEEPGGRSSSQWFSFLLVLLVSGAVLLATHAGAQVPLPDNAQQPAVASLPSPLTPDAVRELVSRLSDQEVRALLLERLDAVAARELQQATREHVEAFNHHATIGVFQTVREAVERLPRLWSSQIESFQTFSERIGPGGLWILFGALALGVSVGLVGEFIFNRLTRRWHIEAPGDGQRSLRSTIRFLFNRLCKDVFGVLVFFIVAQQFGPLVIRAVFGDAADLTVFGPYILIIWSNFIVFPRLGAAVGRFLLAPSRPEHRLVFMDDWSARFLFRNQVNLIVLMGFSIAVVEFNSLNGVVMGESRLGFWLNLAVHVFIIYIAIRAWDGLVMMMRGSDPDVTPAEAWVARSYPWFVIGLSIGTWWLVSVISSYGAYELLITGAHYKMMFLLSFAPIFDTAIRGLVRHVVPPMTGDGLLAERAYISTKRSYIRIGRVLIFAMVLLLSATFWPVDFHDIAAGGVGIQVAAGIIEFLWIAAAGYLVWELVSLWINRKLAQEQTAAGFDLTEDEPGGGEGGGAGGSRLSTVLPLVLGVAKAAIAVIFGLIALGNIGIDITPLLAGAGIVGLAIGFGAQKLVADVVSGIFFLVDDAFRTGEYVEIEGTVGTVEKISIRSMQLRHHRGPVHTIPYGEIPKLTNYSRDWVIMKLKFTVPFDTDPNKVKRLFKQIGKDMMEVPEFEADLLQPFKSQGVFDFDDVGMIIRGKFMAKPGRQFVLRKEVYNRVKKAFEENGIEFARREVRIAVPGLGAETGLNPEQTAVVAEAAAVAVQDNLVKENAPEK